MPRIIKQRKKRTSSVVSLPVLRPNAAGIDIGAREIYVAVPPDRDPHPVRAFPTFTSDLLELADWLKHCGVDTVAKQLLYLWRHLPHCRVFATRDTFSRGRRS